MIDNMKTQIVLIIGILGVLVISGCTNQSGPVCNPPYIVHGDDCCLDRNGDSICDSDQPEIKQDCPHDCCEGTVYKPKSCNQNEDCINNECVKKPCPYECCSGEVYQQKSCSVGYECVNDKCEEIKEAKLSVSIDGCLTSFNVMQGLGEVTDVFVTIKNYGTKEALNTYISSTANDVDSDYVKSKGTIGAIGSEDSQKRKLTIDTKSGVQTTVSVTATCEGCPSVTSTSSECFTDYAQIADMIAQYLPLLG